MKVKELISLNMYDDFRFYKESEITSIFVDEYTPYIEINDILNSDLKESKVVHFYIGGEYCCNEIIDEWIVVVLKEEEQ